MKIDWLTIVWQAFLSAVRMWAHVIFANPLPWLAILALVIVFGFVPVNRRRRRS